MKLSESLTTILAALLLSIRVMAQPSLEDRILPPAGMVSGRLDNGLSYVLLHNESPTDMVECRLIFRAGSVLEDSTNRGAAHFLEHMAFGGTRHFPGHRLVDCLESMGAQYGIGINAYTGYDRTIYMFTIPSEKQSYMDDALLIMKDWLTDMELSEDKVDAEKGIIIEELRGYDTGDPFYDLKIGIGRYSRGIPLGTEEDIRKITSGTLKDFHDRWYTLSQATIVLVGDIDTSETEKLIRRRFGHLKTSASDDYQEYPNLYAKGVSYAEVCDSLGRNLSLDLMIPHKSILDSKLGDCLKSSRIKLLVRALNRRLGKMGDMADVSNNWYLADKDHFCISATAQDRESLAGKISRTITELSRVASDGFYENELAEVKSDFVSSLSLPNWTVSSEAICEEIEDAVLFDEWTVTDPEQFGFILQMIAETTSDDLQGILGSILADARESLLAACRTNALHPRGFSADEIARLWESALVAEPSEYVYEPSRREEPVEVTVPEFLLQDREYDKSAIVSRRTYPNMGMEEVVLRNGFRFLLRPTSDEEKKIQIHILAPGGLSAIPLEKFPLLEGMNGYMDLGGIEGMSDDDYSSLLGNKGIAVLAASQWYWHDVIASAPSSELRLLLNLIYRKMTAPRLNFEDFEELRAETLEHYGESSYLATVMDADPARQVAAKIDSLMGNVLCGRRMTPSKEEVAALSLDDIARYYLSLYTNPDGMSCVVCGDFETESFLREAVPVFASLERHDAPNRYGPSLFELPQEGGLYVFPNPNPTQTVFDCLLCGYYEPDLRTGLILKLMRDVIRNRLISVLRQEESLVYSPFISLFYTAVPDKIWYYDINASVDRKNTGRAFGVITDIIRDLQKNKISKKELHTLQNIFIVNKRKHLEESATANWKGQIVYMVMNAEGFEDFDNYEKVLRSITPEDLRTAFQQYLDLDSLILVSMGGF
ncbi:MAG: M16 family metallopeptidase [Candidatus Cryptobacteroides sp.]